MSTRTPADSATPDARTSEQGIGEVSAPTLLTSAFEDLADFDPDEDGWSNYGDLHGRVTKLIRLLRDGIEGAVRLGASILFAIPDEPAGASVSVDAGSLDWRAVHAVRWTAARLVTVPFEYESSLPGGRVGLISRDAYWYVVLDRDTVLGRIWPGGGGGEPKWWAELAPGLENASLEDLWSDSFLEVLASIVEATVETRLAPAYRADREPEKRREEGRQWVLHSPTVGALDEPDIGWPEETRKPDGLGGAEVAENAADAPAPEGEEERPDSEKGLTIRSSDHSTERGWVILSDGTSIGWMSEAFDGAIGWWGYVGEDLVTSAAGVTFGEAVASILKASGHDADRYLVQSAPVRVRNY